MAEFTCGICGGTFTKGTPDKEAQAEAESIYTPAELADPGLVCGDCFPAPMRALPRIRAEIDQEAAAAGLCYEEYMLREAGHP